MIITTPTLIDFSALSCGEVIGCILTGLMALTIAAILGCMCAEEFKGSKKKTVFLCVGITLLITLALICFFGFAATTLRGIIICLALLYGSLRDIKTRECDNAPFLVIAVAALIGCPLTNLPNMLLAGFIAFVLQFGGAIATDSDISGADLKCACACCFALGLTRGLFGLVVGMTLAIIVNLIRLSDKKAGFPELPYLAVGFMAAYFI